jgi:hypothetical protein
MQKTPTYPTTNGSQDETCNLSGLELARHVMKKLTDDHLKIEELAHHNFDGNKKFVLAIVDFLSDNGWMREDEKHVGDYIVTDKGRRECQ